MFSASTDSRTIILKRGVKFWGEMLLNLWKGVYYFYGHHKENLNEKKKNHIIL